MEIRVNMAFFAVICLAAAALTASRPAAALDPADPMTVALADMEDRFALAPNDAELARDLAEAYLDMNRPGLALAALRSADPSLHDDPMIAHRLAQAYEGTGRVLDAYATAQFARNRCARLMSEGPADGMTCRARELASLDVHTRALATMVEIGVRDPSTDPRATRAYQSALRITHIAMR